MYYYHNIKKKGISDNYLPNYHTRIKMVITNDFKCKICNKVTRIKYEVSSESSSFHSYVPCRNCKTMFYGEYLQDDEEVKAIIKFKNADKVEEYPDYVCTITRDFITNKVQEVTSQEDLIDLPMWMKFRNMLGHDEYENIFRKRVHFLLELYNNSRHKWSNIMELWFNNELSYLDEQLKNLYNLKGNISDSERLSCIRNFGTDVLTHLHRKEILDYIKQKNLVNLNEILLDKKEKLNDYLKELDKNNELIELEQIIYSQIKRALEYIPNLIPIITIDYFNEESKKEIFNENFHLGIYSFEFDEIKQLYQDLFETHTKLLYFFIGIDNIKLRGDYDSFKSGSRYNTLNRYKAEGIAFKKINEIDENSLYCSELKKYLDNHMRNMIGHCSYKLDPVTQVIKYKNGENTLIEVVYYCYKLILELYKHFQVITQMYELLLSGELDK